MCYDNFKMNLSGTEYEDVNCGDVVSSNAIILAPKIMNI
jgi:hypothetical protein